MLTVVWRVTWRVLVASYAVYNIGGAPGAAEGWGDVLAPFDVTVGRILGIALLLVIATSLAPRIWRNRARLLVRIWLRLDSVESTKPAVAAACGMFAAASELTFTRQLVAPFQFHDHDPWLLTVAFQVTNRSAISRINVNVDLRLPIDGQQSEILHEGRWRTVLPRLFYPLPSESDLPEPLLECPITVEPESTRKGYLSFILFNPEATRDFNNVNAQEAQLLVTDLISAAAMELEVPGRRGT